MGEHKLPYLLTYSLTWMKLSYKWCITTFLFFYFLHGLDIRNTDLRAEPIL